MIDRDNVRARKGTQIGGWRLGSVLGLGAMAAVYHASDGEREGAIKVLHQTHRDNTTVTARFRREVEIMALAEHPAAVQIYEQATEADGELYYVMERLRGRTLRDDWKEFEGRMPFELVVEYAIDVLDVLDIYHAMGVLHRDVKPSNVFVTETGQLKLLDFGVARFHGTGDVPPVFTRDGSSIGTPAFMSPEQAMGKLDHMGPHSDVFSVGAMIVALLSGKRLRGTAASSEEAVVLAATTPPESLVHFLPDAPPELVEIVDRALAWVPEDRYRNAADMRDALKAMDTDSDQPMSFLSEEAIKQAAAVADVPVDIPDEEDLLQAIDDVVRDSVEVFRRIQKALEGKRLYGREHREAKRRLKNCFEAMEQCLDPTPDGVTWRIRPGEIEVAGTPVWEPEAPFDSVPYNLFVSGIRHLKFTPSLQPDEFLAFVDLLTMDPERDLPLEDDLATALWDLDLRNVEAQMVTTFQVSDDPAEQARFEQEVQEFRDEVGADITEAAAQLLTDLITAASVSEGAVREMQRETRADRLLVERGKQGVLSPDFYGQFQTAIQRVDAEDTKVAWILAAACNDAWAEGDFERLGQMLAEFIPRQLPERGIAGVTRLAQRVVMAIDDSGAREQFLESFYSGHNVVLVARRLLHPELELDRELGTRCAQFLQYGEEDAFDEIIELLPEIGMPRARILALYVASKLEGRGADAAQLVLEGDSDTIEFALHVARTTRFPRAAAVMIAPLLADEDDDISHRAFELFESRFPAELEAWLDVVLQQDDPDLRVRAMRIAGEHRFSSIVDYLVRYANDKGFASTPYTERRLVLETLFLVDRHRAEEIACNLIRGRRFWQMDKALDTTRAMAIELLGEHCNSKRALDTIKDATTRRSGNPERVRQAAQLALETFQRRAGES